MALLSEASWDRIAAGVADRLAREFGVETAEEPAMPLQLFRRCLAQIEGPITPEQLVRIGDGFGLSREEITEAATAAGILASDAEVVPADESPAGCYLKLVADLVDGRGGAQIEAVCRAGRQVLGKQLRCDVGCTP